MKPIPLESPRSFSLPHSPGFFSPGIFLQISFVLVLSFVLLVDPANSEVVPMKSTRQSVLAGSWYSADPAVLADNIDAHLSAGKPLEKIAREAPIAIISPHAGHQWSGDAAGTVFRLLSGPAGEKIKRVILLGPSHHMGYRGASILPVDHYETPLGPIPLDTEVVTALLEQPLFQTNDTAHRQEHCLEIELPFLQRVLKTGFRIVPILISQLKAAEWSKMAETLSPFIDRETLLVISSDFTHYGSRFGYLPFNDHVDQNLKQLDLGALTAIQEIKPEQFAAYHADTDITVCGYQSIGVLLEMLRSKSFAAVWGDQSPEGRVIDYYRSADKSGDFANSVSYASVAFFRAGMMLPGDAYPKSLLPELEDSPGGASELTAPEQRYLLALARETLSEVLGGKPKPEPGGFPAEVAAHKMKQKCGIFVTLTKNGHLRGCIGSIIGHEPLVYGVINRAVSSALEDPRFPAVTSEELSSLEIEISVLSPLERAGGPDEIEVGRHGVVLEKDGRRSVFLPQVAPEQGWDRDTMLDQLAIKAGLPKEAWRSGASFDLFEAFVFSEGDH